LNSEPRQPPSPERSWLAGFRRITTTGDYIPEIDGLRFIAIWAVVFYHVALSVGKLDNAGPGAFRIGAKGVELFFVISGFVLATPFAKQHLLEGRKVRLGQYFLRRVTRLEPPYLLALLLMFLLKAVVSSRPVSELLMCLDASAVYLHNAMFGVTSLILGVAWSLEVEVQFYVLMPLLAAVFLIKHPWLRRLVLAAAALAVVLVQPILLPPIVRSSTWLEATAPGVFVQRSISTQAVDFHLGNYIQYFLAGLLLADVYVVNWKSNPAPKRWGDAVWLLGWPVLIFAAFHLDRLPARLAFPVLIFCLYAAVFRSSLSRRVMSLPILTAIGGMCYSIYLLHNPAIELACAGIRGALLGRSYSTQMLIASLIAIPAVLAISAIYFRLIEKPCMRRDWPRRLWDRLSSWIFIEEPAADAPQAAKDRV
jgi:peptidoglycan/LPS O-acetylase OafA/YrhL